MICPYCHTTNYEYDSVCRKCQTPLLPTGGTVYAGKQRWFGREKARMFRNKALAALVLGLLIKVYWGGYGPWPVIDYPPLANLRTWFEPLLIFGGIAAYLCGWVLHFV